MEICARVYRPRRPRESPLFRLVEQHFEEFLRVYPERFAKAHGPLRPVVGRVLRGFLTCGLVEHGFARAWCETCRLSYLIPYSCRGRSFCPSCEKKRSLLWAEWLREEVLEPVAHRHVVFTMARLLRGIFRKRRELLLDLSQCGAEALSEYMRRELGADARPGIVVSVASSGDLLQWHVHLHVLATDGAFSDDGTFHPLARPEDRQAAKAARFPLTTSPGGGVVCLRNGDQSWEDASRRALPLRHTAGGHVEGRSPPHYPRRRLLKPRLRRPRQGCGRKWLSVIGKWLSVNWLRTYCSIGIGTVLNATSLVTAPLLRAAAIVRFCPTPRL